MEVRAGLMTHSSGRLHPDPRRGILSVCPADSPGHFRVRWKERDAEGAAACEVETSGPFTLVQICRPDGNIMHLKPGDGTHPDLFFWSQEPADSQAGAALLALMRPSPSPPPPAEPPVADAAVPIGASALAAALSNLGAAAGNGSSGVRAGPAGGPSLASVLRPATLVPLLARRPELVEAMAPHLPEAHRTPEAIAHLVTTPQFRHTLDVLTQALNSGQLHPSHFGVPAEGFGTLALLQGLQRQADQQKPKE
ncbi:CGL124 [Auxenochlorella protothecoides x Auxenochlorella symbiontica]